MTQLLILLLMVFNCSLLHTVYKVSGIPVKGISINTYYSTHSESQITDYEMKQHDFLSGKPMQSIAFTQKQIQYLISEFKKKYSNNGTSKVNVTSGETIEIWSDGAKGFVPGVSFSAFYDAKFCNDFDQDGSKEIFFIVNETAGGIAEWQTIYCLKENKAGAMNLIRVKYACPCQKPYKCQDSPHPGLNDTIGKLLVVVAGCLDKNDAECCPGHYFEMKYQFKNGSLMMKSKREIVR